MSLVQASPTRINTWITLILSLILRDPTLRNTRQPRQYIRHMTAQTCLRTRTTAHTRIIAHLTNPTMIIIPYRTHTNTLMITIQYHCTGNTAETSVVIFAGLALWGT